MDDELEGWAVAWRSMEEKNMNLLNKAKTARRHEVLARLGVTAALAVGAAAVTGKLARALSAGELSERWYEVGLGGLSLVLGGLVILRWGRQIAAARALLEETPLGMVSDLIRRRERELGWWVGKWALVMSGVLVAVGVEIVGEQLRRAQAAGEPLDVALRKLGILVVYLLGLGVVGVLRARFLRRELVALSELQAQLG